MVKNMSVPMNRWARGCRILFATIVGLFLSTAVSCVANEKPLYTDGDMLNMETIGARLPPLDLARAALSSPEIRAYRKFYGLDGGNVRHSIGQYKSNEMAIAGQVFLPSRPMGTFFLLHGYFDHSATLKNLITACLEKHFAVALFDLPGHGLSSGERGAVGDFSEYASILRDFICTYAKHLPKPFYLAAHSTGCAAAYEYLHHDPPLVFDKIVFLAPLVRHAHWHLSTIGYHLVKPFTDSLPRMHRRNSSDEPFLEFTRNDPLQVDRVSIRFLDALRHWNRRIQRYAAVTQPVLVIQGTDDDVVDWKYNLEFLKTKIVGLEIEMVDGAKHQLVNENQALRQLVFERLFEFVAIP